MVGTAGKPHGWNIPPPRSEKHFSCELQDILSRFPFTHGEGVVDRVMVPPKMSTYESPEPVTMLGYKTKGHPGCSSADVLLGGLPWIVRVGSIEPQESLRVEKGDTKHRQSDVLWGLYWPFLAFKTAGGAMSQGMRVASGNWKRPGNILPESLQRGNTALLTPWFLSQWPPKL